MLLSLAAAVRAAADLVLEDLGDLVAREVLEAPVLLRFLRLQQPPLRRVRRRSIRASTSTCWMARQRIQHPYRPQRQRAGLVALVFLQLLQPPQRLHPQEAAGGSRNFMV